MTNPWREPNPTRSEILAFLERLRDEPLPPLEPRTYAVSRAEYDRMVRDSVH